MAAAGGKKYMQYGQAVLEGMWENSTEVGETFVWRGGLINFVHDLVPAANPGKILALLKSSGAIRMTIRGGGGVPSEYQLMRHELEKDDEGNAVDFSVPDWFTPTSPQQRNEGQIQQLNVRINALETRIRIVEAALIGQELVQGYDEAAEPRESVSEKLGVEDDGS